MPRVLHTGPPNWIGTGSGCVLWGMSLLPVRYAATTLLLVGGLTACGHAQGGGGSGATSTTTGTASTTTGTSSTGVPITPPVTVPPTGHLTLTGVPQAGVGASCILLDRYVLVGGTQPQRALLEAGTTAGSAVTVAGHTDKTLMSHCQQGTLLVVDDVRAGT